MSRIDISLSHALKAFLDGQASQGGYGTGSEHVRELIRRDRDGLQLRGLLLAGAASASAAPADPGYFESLRSRARESANLRSKE